MTTEMGQTTMWMSRRRYETGDYSRNLYELVKDFEEGIIRVPSFQREFCWPLAKQEQFVRRLLDNRKPIGVIATYELDGDSNAIVYLNDGLQRLSTLRRLMREPNLFGLDSENAERVLKAFNFSLQHRNYRNHDEAAEDYKDINQGTILTAMEFFKSDLVNIPDYDSVWRERIERLHDRMAEWSLSVCAKPQSERTVAHRYFRHDMSLFFRFATGETSVTDHRVNAKQASIADRQHKTYIEYRFAQWLVSHGYLTYDQKLDSLMSVVRGETAIIESEFRKIQKEPGVRIGVVLYRWLLDVAVWRRNNKIDTETWRTFVSALMTKTNGTTTIPGTGKKYAYMIMGDLSRLKLVCNIIGSDMYGGEQSSRASRRPSNAQPGYDVSHVKPFSLYGEGPTIMEPEGINRARGAKPIETE